MGTNVQEVVILNKDHDDNSEDKDLQLAIMASLSEERDLQLATVASLSNATTAACLSQDKDLQLDTMASLLEATVADMASISEYRDLHPATTASLETELFSKEGSNPENPISVSDDRDLQLAITASLQHQHQSEGGIHQRVINPSQDYFNYDHLNDDHEAITSLSTTPVRKNFFIGESSYTRTAATNNGNDSVDSGGVVEGTFLCDICVDEKPKALLFCIKGCVHSYCSECMTKYVASKLQDNITVISCPVSGCNGRLEPENCWSILPDQVFDRWGDALCEALLLASEKFYCPYKDCSSLLIDDRGGIEEVIRESECPHCRRLFCANCRVPWHSEVTCDEFQKLNKDESEREDIMLMKLAENNKWRRCPECKMYVERISGCVFMICRCSYRFCYNCGAQMGTSHSCANCGH